jgi:hypothetical protein
MRLVRLLGSRHGAVDNHAQPTGLAREVAREFGYDLPVTGCFEFTARNLGARQQAEWIDAGHRGPAQSPHHQLRATGTRGRRWAGDPKLLLTQGQFL